MKAYEWFGVVFVSLSALGCGGVCGDGELSKDEACDDGNVLDADGCEANCALPACANGIVDPGELCFNEKRFPAPSLGASAAFLAIGEVSGDARPDIGIALRDSNAVVVLDNQGSNSFAAEQFFSLPAGRGPQDLVMADLSGDGRLDLVTVNQTTNDVSVLVNAQNQPFTQEVISSVAAEEPSTLLVVNVDAQPASDVISRNAGASDNLSVLLNNGSGSLTPATGSPLVLLNGGVPVDIFSGDLDQDGQADILAADDNRVLQIFFGSGNGQFEAPIEISSFAQGIAEVSASDVDQDGFLDLLVVAGDLEGSLFVLLNQQNRNFLPDGIFDFAFDSNADFFVVDVNSDGDFDFVSRNSAGVDISFGDGSGAFEPPARLTSISNVADELEVVDVNGDTIPDMILLDILAGEVVVFFSEP